MNPARVARFERQKDTALCQMVDGEAAPGIPVSRGRLAEVRAALGL
jgi:DNA-binding LytR/AlgR family response regulator